MPFNFYDDEWLRRESARLEQGIGDRFGNDYFNDEALNELVNAFVNDMRYGDPQPFPADESYESYESYEPDEPVKKKKKKKKKPKAELTGDDGVDYSPPPPPPSIPPAGGRRIRPIDID